MPKNAQTDEQTAEQEVVTTEALQEGEAQAESGDETAATEVTAAKRPKKLTKAIEGTVVKITVEGGEQGEMSFDTAELPEKIQHSLIPFGAGHKLGDSAAGRSGKEAEEAILKVWEGLKAGDWSVRAPAAAKVSLNDIMANLANMGEAEREAAKALLAQVGIVVK